MSTYLNAHLVTPTHLMDQVDIYINIAQDSVDSGLESDFDDYQPEILHRPIANAGRSRTATVARRPAKRTRGLAEVAAEVSRS